MSNIIQFPTESKKAWDVMEKLFRTNILDNISASPEQLDRFLEHFKPIFNSFEFNHQFSFENIDEKTFDQLNSEFDKFKLAMQSHTNQIILERLMLEIKLFNW